MNEVVTPESIDKVKFRQDILTVQTELKAMIADGTVESIEKECTLTHYFSPIDSQYGCCTYARQMFIPKGSLIIGKIHRHQHLNFILKGKISVATEFGKKYFEAPCTFISEVGIKRAVYAEEDTIWATVHMTKFNSEEDLDKIEQEVIAPTYADMGLISSVDAMPQILAQGD